MILHRSHRLEHLVDALVQVVDAPPPGLDGPALVTLPELIGVEDPALAGWLSQELAERLGVWANPRFSSPRELVDGILAATLDATMRGGPRAHRRWDPPALGFAVAAALAPDREEPLEETEALSALRAALERQPGDRERLGLSARIAESFDRYALHRPFMVRDWDRGGDMGAETEGDRWQPVLWRRVRRKLGPRHLAFRAAAFLARLEEAPETLDLLALPPRVCVFAPSSLPPLLLDVLKAVGRLRPVHLFLRAHRLRPLSPGTLPAHPLQLAWGKPGRELEALVGPIEDALPVEEVGGGPLQELQRDILEDRPAPRPLPTDPGIEIHSAAGPVRQLQVLHDRLLHLFQEDPALQPEDVLVLLPDLLSWAPWIDAVFGGRRGQPDALPYRIIDRRPLSATQTGQAFLSLLSVVEGRLGAAEVVELLAREPVRRRFGIAAGDLGRVRELVQQAGIRQAADGSHRGALGHPGEELHTWRFGLDRLLLGAALGDEDALWAGVLPVGANDGDTLALLGRLAELCDALARLRAQAAEPRPVEDWSRILAEAAVRFLAEDDDSTREGGALRAQVVAMGEQARLAGFLTPVGLSAIRARLEATLSESDDASAIGSRGISFCGLKPGRAVPARVVCLLGLDEDALPRPVRVAGWDLVARRGRMGDPSPRDLDRQVVLEALLSAGDRLILGYGGRDQQDGSDRPPSAVVGELLDALGPRASTARLVIRHPLHPFSPRCFPVEGMGSFHRGWWEAARVLAGRAGMSPAPATGGDEPRPYNATGGDEPRPYNQAVGAGFIPARPHEAAPALSALHLADLARFFANPARGLLRDRLRLRLDDCETALAEHPLLTLDPLSGYHLGDALLRHLLDQPHPHRRHLLARARAGGLLPGGAPGEVALRRLLPAVEAVASAIRPFRRGDPQEQHPVDLQLGDQALRGELDRLWPGARLEHGFRRLRGPVLLRAWIHHLVLQLEAERSSHLPRKTAVIGRARRGSGAHALLFRPVEKAGPLLQELVQLYQEGQRVPLAFFPEAALAYARARRSASPERALSQAKEAIGDRYGEGADPYVQAAHGGPPRLDEAFVELAETVMRPLLDHLEEG